jgi:hypothetical protein
MFCSKTRQEVQNSVEASTNKEFLSFLEGG